MHCQIQRSFFNYLLLHKCIAKTLSLKINENKQQKQIQQKFLSLCLFAKKTTKLLNKITPLVVKKRFKETCAGGFTLPMCSLSFAFEKFLGRKSNRYAFNLVFLRYHTPHQIISDVQEKLETKNKKRPMNDTYLVMRVGKQFKLEVKL